MRKDVPHFIYMNEKIKTFKLWLDKFKRAVLFFSAIMVLVIWVNTLWNSIMVLVSNE